MYKRKKNKEKTSDKVVKIYSSLRIGKQNLIFF